MNEPLPIALKTICTALFVIIFTALFFLNSCDITPAGDYYVEVDPPEENPDASFILTPNPDSLMYIFNKMTFNITALIGERIMRQVNVYVDEELAKSVENHNFSLDPVNFESGLHLMEIEIIFSTGTGSLGDIIGAENYVSKYTREIYTDPQVPEPININSVSLTDKGRLRLDWDKFESIKFEKYVLYRTLKLSDDEILHDSVQIFDMHHNWWIDSTALYGQANYYLKLFATQWDPMTGENYQKSLGNFYCDLHIYTNPLYVLDAGWREISVFGNLQAFKITLSNSGTLDDLFVTEDPFVSDALVQVGMRKSSTYTFQAISRPSTSFQAADIIYSKSISIGEPSPEYEIMHFAPYRSYALLNQKIYALDSYGNVISESDGIFTTASLLAISDNEDYIMTNHHNAIAFLNRSNLSDVEIIQISDISGEVAKVTCADVSDNGSLVAILDNGEIMGYNYETDSLLFKFYQPNATEVIADISGESFLAWDATVGEILHYQYYDLPLPVSTQIGTGYSSPKIYSIENDAHFVSVKQGNLEQWDLMNLVNTQSTLVAFDDIVNIGHNGIFFAIDHDQSQFQFYELPDMELLQNSPTDYANECLVFRYPFVFVKGRKFKLNIYGE